MKIKDIVKVVEEVMKAEGATKILVRDKGNCFLVIGDLSESVVVASIAKGEFSNGFIIKVIPSDKIANIPWECRYLEYVPYGLYLIADDIDAIRRELPSKIRKVMKYL